jgi:4-amino-4-deoxy-L-arabinose transferase-like glycosyltransferase
MVSKPATADERARSAVPSPPAARPHLYLVQEAVNRPNLVYPLLLMLALTGGAVLRLWQFNSLGLNTDEAVYAGQAAGVIGDATLKPFFPVFRAHPMLFQFIVSLGFLFGVNDWVGRLFSIAIGLATLYLVYRLGALLYGRQAAVFATLFLALMPYHVIVTRQIILDGPMTFCATLSLYLVARFATSHHPEWLYAAGAALGLTFLAKETGIILVGAVYAFLALSPEIRVRIRDLVLSLVSLGLVMAAFPLAVTLAGGTKSAQSYFIWQLFRRPNHEWTFYPTEVSLAVGPLILLLVGVGLWRLWPERTWRERLLLAWVLVPLGFFQLWPTKGYQYLLPIAPALVLLAGRTLARWPGRDLRWRRWQVPGSAMQPLVALLVALTLLIPSWNLVQPVLSNRFLAGTGGVPGGREAGQWIETHLPVGARLVTLGPSMANILQFYGHRKAYGLSVSPNPLHRNPSYEPVQNPDFQLRSGAFQYLVWDSFSEARSPAFATQLLAYVQRFNGRVVHTESVPVTTPEGAVGSTPIIIIYEVHP